MPDLFNTKPITVWERYDKDKEKWVHNHIEDGHKHGKPEPKSERQQVWGNYVWWGKHKHIDKTGTIF